MKNDFELGVGGEGQDTSQHFEGVLGLWVQYIQFEASEQKMGQKPKYELKEIIVNRAQNPKRIFVLDFGLKFFRGPKSKISINGHFSSNFDFKKQNY